MHPYKKMLHSAVEDDLQLTARRDHLEILELQGFPVSNDIALLNITIEENRKAIVILKEGGEEDG